MKQVCSSNIAAVNGDQIQFLPADSSNLKSFPVSLAGGGLPAALLAGSAGLAGAKAGQNISRRAALQRLALAGTGLALGLGMQQAKSAVLPPPNNNLGVAMDINSGIWYTQCVENSGASCVNPIWKHFLNQSASLGYVNNSYAGNSAGFGTLGGTSDMFAIALPIVAGAIYKVSFTGEILSSTTDNDQLHFIINQTSTVDIMNRTAGRSTRSVLVVGEDNMELRWHFVKASGSNGLIKFRADNLQITQLPVPVLHAEKYDANNVVVWWDAIFGNEQQGTYLLESPPPYGLENPSFGINVEPPYMLLDGSNNPVRYGKIVSIFASPKYFKLQVQGTPSVL
jgi:hypothetical protein